MIMHFFNKHKYQLYACFTFTKQKILSIDFKFLFHYYSGMENLITENKMGVMPIPRLVLTMALPLMLSMLTQALYNVVDSIFVANVGEHALTAVSLAFPIQNLMVATVTGTGVGINALLSMKLGQKDYNAVNRTAVNGIFLALCSYIFFVILGLAFIPMYFQSQTTDLQILQHGLDYTNIVVHGSFGLFFVVTFNRLLQATGKTIYGMLIQMSGVVINLILDPIMIFGLFGFPRMETAGAALATILGQIGSMCVGIYFNLKVNKEIHLSFKKFRPDLQSIKTIYKVGIPSIVMASIGSVMVYALNIILAAFSSTAIAVFGVFFKLNSFAIMPVLGLNNGLVPIIAYNIGAKHRSRVLTTIKVSTLFAFLFTVAATSVFLIFPRELLSLFNASSAMIEMGIPALRIMSLMFLLAGFGITFSGVFQALGNGLLSLCVSVVRQLVFIVPVAWLLAQTGKLENVWWAFPIAEIAGMSLSAIFMIHMNKKVLSKIGEE